MYPADRQSSSASHRRGVYKNLREGGVHIVVEGELSDTQLPLNGGTALGALGSLEWGWHKEETIGDVAEALTLLSANPNLCTTLTVAQVQVLAAIARHWTGFMGTRNRVPAFGVFFSGNFASGTLRQQPVMFGALQAVAACLVIMSKWLGNALTQAQDGLVEICAHCKHVASALLAYGEKDPTVGAFLTPRCVLALASAAGASGVISDVKDVVWVISDPSATVIREQLLLCTAVLPDVVRSLLSAAPWDDAPKESTTSGAQSNMQASLCRAVIGIWRLSGPETKGRWPDYASFTALATGMSAFAHRASQAGKVACAAKVLDAVFLANESSTGSLRPAIVVAALGLLQGISKRPSWTGDLEEVAFSAVRVIRASIRCMEMPMNKNWRKDTNVAGRHFFRCLALGLATATSALCVMSRAGTLPGKIQQAAVDILLHVAFTEAVTSHYSKHDGDEREMNLRAPLLHVSPSLFHALGELSMCDRGVTGAVFLKVRDAARGAHSAVRIAGLIGLQQKILASLLAAMSNGIASMIDAVTRSPLPLAVADVAVAVDMLSFCQRGTLSASGAGQQELFWRLVRVVEAQGDAAQCISKILLLLPTVEELSNDKYWFQEAKTWFPEALNAKLDDSMHQQGIASAAGGLTTPKQDRTQWHELAVRRAQLYVRCAYRWILAIGHRLPPSICECLIPLLLGCCSHGGTSLSKEAHPVLWQLIAWPRVILGNSVQSEGISSGSRDTYLQKQLLSAYMEITVGAFPETTSATTLATTVGMVIGSLGQIPSLQGAALRCAQLLRDRVIELCSVDPLLLGESVQTGIFLFFETLKIVPPKLLSELTAMVSQCVTTLHWSGEAVMDMLYASISQGCGPTRRNTLAMWFITLLEKQQHFSASAIEGASSIRSSVSFPKSKL
ncbi:unnamed protein product [Discosporangium mesarthrocarpum]